jgi:hypothetical protein
MSNYTYLKNAWVDFHERDDAKEDEANAVRFYGYSPDRACLQIRGHKPLVKTSTYNPRVKARNLFSSAMLDADELRTLRDAIDEELARLAMLAERRAEEV